MTYATSHMSKSEGYLGVLRLREIEVGRKDALKGSKKKGILKNVIVLTFRFFERQHSKNSLSSFFSCLIRGEEFLN